MKNLRYIIMLVIALVVITNSACSTDLYDQEKAQEFSDSISPVDTIDPYHNWQLTTSTIITATANQEVGAKWLKILTADPLEESNAQIVAQVPIADGESTSLSICYSNLLTTLYAALVDEQGRYTLTEFDPEGSRQVDFSEPLYVSQTPKYRPEHQVFAYCFEEELPDLVNVDFDYNDVRLDISLERTDVKEMRIHVKLAAVGANYQAAAGIRLRNFEISRIDTAYTVNNTSFNLSSKGTEVPDQTLVVQKKKDLLLPSLNNEAVINLFSDAHWATGDLDGDYYGQLTRKKYNVGGSGTNAVSMVPREITYVINFDSENGLNYLNFDLLDPFIIKEFNSGIFEVHEYSLRNDCVFNNYLLADVVRLPWVLVIPYEKFRHPLDGVNIGFIKRNIVGFGAYAYRGHSFGEWSQNRETAQDWYLNEYASNNQVY